MNQNFVALTQHPGELDWLQNSLASAGQVVPAGSASLEELLALLDVTAAGVLFISLGKSNLVSQGALVEGLVSARPMLSVVAIGDGLDNQLVLAAMRAGARDFITYGARASELTGLIRRLGGRLPSVPVSAARQGELLTLVSARPDADGAFVALHLAKALQEQTPNQVLLLDVGQPTGEALAILGLDSAFTFSDALRNLRRLDQTLIDSAFTRLDSGLRILSLTDEPGVLERVTTAELYLLLGNLRGAFSHVVVNLTGLPEGELSNQLLVQANRVLWMVDQSVPSCKKGLERLRRLRERNLPLPSIELLIERYLPNVAPDQQALSRMFDLDLFGVLPLSPESRLRAEEPRQEPVRGGAARPIGGQAAATGGQPVRDTRRAPFAAVLARPGQGGAAMSTGFGARPDGGAFHSRQEQDIQALKLRLHRYIIDEIDEDGMNLLEGARSAVVQYVSEKVCEYGSRHQLAISRYELDRLAEEVVDELTGFGPLEILLRDPGVSEILVNGPGRVFVEREGRLYQSDLRFIDDHHVLRVIQRILAPLGRRLDESSPMVDARLPDGSRVNAIIPPVALDGPCISIRKFSQELLRSADLLAYQSVDEALLEFLRQAVSRRCNILISGGTGTGKTTLLNVISGFIDERERIVTIEDTAELQLGHDHVVRLETRPPNAEGYGEVTARDLIRNALRMRPDRIILGEIRGVEVLDVLQAMNTGHDGSMSTVHANSAMDSLLRMEMLVGLTGNRLPEQTLRLMIAPRWTWWCRSPAWPAVGVASAKCWRCWRCATVCTSPIRCSVSTGAVAGSSSARPRRSGRNSARRCCERRATAGAVQRRAGFRRAGPGVHGLARRAQRTGG
ncbi:putative type II secretion system protein [Pseudomonas aeruginosa]|nr:putative type II secretion system protein [Pseudomonas aeruginosa]